MLDSSDPIADDHLDVVVVTVTWNSATHLPGLIASLPAAMEGVPTWGLVVADNASSDDTLATLARVAPAAVVVQTGSNVGYAAGINAAMRVAPGHLAVLVLNPDVRLRPGSVRSLLSTATETRAGIIVPRQVDGDGATLPTLRREPSVLRVWGEALLGGTRAGRLSVGELIVDPSSYARRSRAAWATGSVMLITQACWRRVGAWDESFFLYSEETDFALRARDVGFPLVLEPTAVVEHLLGDSHASARLWALLVSNRVVLFARRHGAGAAWLFWAGLILGEATRGIRGRAPSRHAAARLWRSRSALVGGVTVTSDE